MSNDWAQQLAEELHKPITRKFTKRRVFVKGVDEIWAADLVEMGRFSDWNKGIKYMLMVIDVFSKFGWIEPLQNKKGETVAAAFKKIFKLGRQPRLLWTDKGKEFYNKNVNQLLSRKNIKLYSTENEEKSSVAERINRTIKQMMWKMFSANNNTIYVDKIDELLKNYNSSFHRSVQMSPAAVSDIKNKHQVFANLYSDEIYKQVKGSLSTSVLCGRVLLFSSGKLDFPTTSIFLAKVGKPAEKETFYPCRERVAIQGFRTENFSIPSVTVSDASSTI